MLSPSRSRAGGPNRGPISSIISLLQKSQGINSVLWVSLSSDLRAGRYRGGRRGKFVDATIKAVIERTDGKRLQVDFGKDETALVHLWQVVEKVC